MAPPLSFQERSGTLLLNCENIYTFFSTAAAADKIVCSPLYSFWRGPKVDNSVSTTRIINSVEKVFSSRHNSLKLDSVTKERERGAGLE